MTEEEKKNKNLQGVLKVSSLRQILETDSKNWEPIKTFVANSWSYLEQSPKDVSDINAFLSYQVGHLKGFLKKQSQQFPPMLEMKKKKKKTAATSFFTRFKISKTTAAMVSEFGVIQKEHTEPLYDHLNAMRKTKGKLPPPSPLIDSEKIKIIIALIHKLEALQQQAEIQNNSRKRKELTQFDEAAIPPKISRQVTPPTPPITNITEELDQEDEVRRCYG